MYEQPRHDRLAGSATMRLSSAWSPPASPFGGRSSASAFGEPSTAASAAPAAGEPFRACDRNSVCARVAESRTGAPFVSDGHGCIHSSAAELASRSRARALCPCACGQSCAQQRLPGAGARVRLLLEHAPPDLQRDRRRRLERRLCPGRPAQSKRYELELQRRSVRIDELRDQGIACRGEAEQWPAHSRPAGARRPRERWLLRGSRRSPAGEQQPRVRRKTTAARNRARPLLPSMPASRMRWNLLEPIREPAPRRARHPAQAAARRIALCYPSPYRVGMRSLGFQTIYREIHAAPGRHGRARLPARRRRRLARKRGPRSVTYESSGRSRHSRCSPSRWRTSWR